MSWSPEDKYLWDCWFAWKGEELHAFYLQADRAACQHNPDARHDLSAIGHAVMTPHGWQALNDHEVLSRPRDDAWDNLSLWTGSIIQPAPTRPWHLFYTARRREDAPVRTPAEWQRPQQIGAALSNDLINWRRTRASQTAPVIPNPGREYGLDGVAWRDPYVIRGADGQYYAFICARLDPEKNHLSSDAGGVVAYVSSPDLEQWETQPRLVRCPHEFYQMEVPQIFWRRFDEGLRCYLLFCAQEKDCSPLRRLRGLECETGTYYLQSSLLPHDDQSIPVFAESARLLARGLYAGKLIRPETDDRPLFFGFPWADPEGNFIGGISDPLRARFCEDGALELEHG